MDAVSSLYNPAWDSDFFEMIAVFDALDRYSACDVCQRGLYDALIPAAKRLLPDPAPVPNAITKIFASIEVGESRLTILSDGGWPDRVGNAREALGWFRPDWWEEVTDHWMDVLVEPGVISDGWTYFQARMWMAFHGRFTKDDLMAGRSFREFLYSHLQFLGACKRAPAGCRCFSVKIAKENQDAKSLMERAAGRAFNLHVHRDINEILEETRNEYRGWRMAPHGRVPNMTCEEEEADPIGFLMRVWEDPRTQEKVAKLLEQHKGEVAQGKEDWKAAWVASSANPACSAPRNVQPPALDEPLQRLLEEASRRKRIISPPSTTEVNLHDRYFSRHRLAHRLDLMRAFVEDWPWLRVEYLTDPEEMEDLSTNDENYIDRRIQSFFEDEEDILCHWEIL